VAAFRTDRGGTIHGPRGRAGSRPSTSASRCGPARMGSPDCRSPNSTRCARGSTPGPDEGVRMRAVVGGSRGWRTVY
jgi:hypothetical protein